MKTHAGEWISAYHDGELHGARLAWVESHLARCGTCRAELEELRRLSALIKSVPALVDQAAPDRVSRPAPLHLPPAQGPRGQKALKTAWQAAPFGLVLAWSFFQSVWLVSSLVLSSGLDDLFPALSLPGVPSREIFSGLFGIPWFNFLNKSIPGPGLGDALIQSIFLNLALTLVIGIFLCGWLASWWAYRTRSTQWITFEF
jgi:hypothetical protein